MFTSTVAAVYLILFTPGVGLTYVPFDNMAACESARKTVATFYPNKGPEEELLRLLSCVKRK